MNIVIDDAIYRLQSSGGISTLWRNLTPALHEALPEFTFDPAQPADIFLSTYYHPAPDGAKGIVMVYDFIAERFPGIPRYTTDSQWKALAIAHADAVVAISQWTALDVKNFTLYPGNVAVAYPATTLERANAEQVWSFRQEYSLPDKYILIVGRRGLYKNVNEYYRAIRLIQGFNIQTVCIGGEDVVEASAYEIGLAKSGRLRQFNVPPEHLAAAYTGALCLVYPSLYEGFGLPVLEAYACGCPVICGDGGALAEINDAALVVDVTRPREIAEALVNMSNPGIRIEHILKGYEVVKRFSWKQMAAQVAGVIRSVAEKEIVA